MKLGAARIALATIALATFGTGAAFGAPYTDGMMLNVGDVSLNFGDCSITASGAVGATQCGQIDVEPLTTGSGTFFDPYVYGFLLSGPLSARGAGDMENVTLSYTISLEDARLAIVGLVASLTGTTTSNVGMSETLREGTVQEGSLVMDGTMPSQAAFLPPGATTLDVTAVVDVVGTSTCGGGSDPCDNEISSISQLFPQDQVGHTVGVPEPTPFSSLGAVMTGCVLWRRRSRQRLAA